MQEHNKICSPASEQKQQGQKFATFFADTNLKAYSKKSTDDYLQISIS